ncbi:PKD domain-containing protein, partial [Candidatus Poribacteria bacterium]
TVTLTVTDDDGSVGTVSYDVTVLDLGPTAEFTWSPEPQDEGSPVEFTDMSASPTDTIVSWLWDFGGLGSSSDENPSYTFVDDGTHTVTLTVTDDDGSVGTVSYGVTVLDLSPTAEFTWSPDPQIEGSPVEFSDMSASPTDVIVFWSWDFGDGQTSTEQNPENTYEDNGIYTVALTVTDDDNSMNTVLHDVTISNVAPIIDSIIGAAGLVYEGSEVGFSGSFIDPGTVDTHTIDWDFGDGTAETDTTLVLTHVYADNGSYTATLTVTDKDGGIGIDTLIVTVENEEPVVGQISVSVEGVLHEAPVIEAGTEIVASAEFTDPGADGHTAVWDWGDSSSMTTTELEFGSRSTSESHIYDTPGVYTIILTMTDDDGGEGESPFFQYVVVYDPEGGFVTGGGWIDSPPGAYTPDDLTDPDLTGRANFGFVSKYKKGEEIPIGNTEFVFHVADLNFHSESYEWLVVAGANAKFKGEGTINDDGNYGFMLTAADGDLNDDDDAEVDGFRIKIWNKDSGDGVVYDNGLGDGDDSYEVQPIGGGSIVVHEDKKKDKDDPPTAPALLPQDTCLLNAYPNPFNPDVWIPYRLSSGSEVDIRIYDMTGRLVRTLSLGHKPVGSYISRSKAAYWDGRNEVGEQVSSGIYFYNFQAGEYTVTRKIVVAR